MGRKEMFERIMVATDGSKPAASAARVVGSFARASSAEVKVVHVQGVETAREAEELLADAVADLQARGVCAEGDQIHADKNHIASALAEYAREFKADLVVLGSRGLSDWESIFKHSVSHQLLSALDCPVLIVRGDVPREQLDAERVVLAVAGGDDVAPAVRAAIAAASTPGSRVLVLHVDQAIFGPQGYAYVEPSEEIRATLATASEMLKSAGIAAEALAAGPGHVADIVAETASRWGADVIVIGSSRIGDLGSILLGSVTHDLLRRSGKPVLVAARSAR